MRTPLVFVGCFLVSFSARGDDDLAGTRGEMNEIRHSVRITVDHGHARMVVRRTVRADGDRHDQAVYGLRIPGGAAAVGLRTLGTSNGRPMWFSGELMEAEAAAAKYREFTGIGGYYPKDPALLSWRDDGQLRLQVFPVAPHAEKTIEYTLVLPTRYEKGRDVLVVEPLGLQGKPPHVAIETARTEDRLWVNGQPYPNGATMAWPGSEGDNDLGLGADGAESFGGSVSEFRVEVARGGAAKLSGRLASVPLTAQGGLVHFRVEATRRLSPMPTQVSLVILVDKSYSVGDRDRNAGVAAVGQVLRRLSTARIAVLGFHRKVEPLYKGFLPGYAASAALDEAEFTAGNGSAIDEAMAAATKLLSTEKAGRERRIYLLSDLLTRSQLAVPSLAPRAKGALLHIGTVSEGEPTLGPQQEGPWAKLARATGGLYWKGQARTNGVEASAMAEVYEEWVRPTRLHQFAIEGLSAVAFHRGASSEDMDPAPDQVSSDLHEGAAFEYLGLPFEHPRQIAARGELWARPVSINLASTVEEERLWSALIFGGDLYRELSPREMMTLAIRGRAVSPVTSYLAIEPGVRPSTEGLERASGTGGGGTGEGTIALGNYSTIGKGGGWDPEKLLRGLLTQARSACKLETKKVTVQIETTFHEIVDVPEVKLDGPGDANCIREAIWAWVLPDGFSEERAEYKIGL